MADSPSEGRQWRGTTGGGNFGQKFLLKILKSVHVVFLYPVLYLIVPFYCIGNYRAFGCIYRYFKQIHHFSSLKSLKKTIQNHLIFGQVVLDRFAVLAGNSKQFDIQVENRKIFDNLLDSPQGFMVVGAHIGNIELFGHIFRQNKKTMNAIVFGGELTGLQQQRDVSFQSHNGKMIPVMPDLSHIFTLKNALDRGEIAVILCDRVCGSRKTISVDFMGHPARFPLGTFLLAAQMNVPVVFLAAVKERGAHYRGFVKLFKTPTSDGTLREKSACIARQYASHLQEVLRNYPEQWFNFYDFWS